MSMKIITKEVLEAAVAECSSINQVLLSLGLSNRGQAYPNLKKKAAFLGVSLEKFSFGTQRKIRHETKDESLIQLFSKHASYRSILFALGAVESGANSRWLRIKQRQLNIQSVLGAADGSMKRPKVPPIPLSELLVFGKPPYKDMKKRLIQEFVLPPLCDVCKLSSWMEKPIPLELHHRNGNRIDNRLENLQLLCSNCHAQTPNYCRGHKGIKEQVAEEEAWLQSLCPSKKIPNSNLIPKHFPCLKCGKMVGQGTSGYCLACHLVTIPRTHTQKILWPSDDLLAAMVWETPVSSLAKRLGVSDKAIAGHCKRRKISTPYRGYWAKKRAGVTR